LAAAREVVPGLNAREEGLWGAEVPRLRLYASEQAHSSVEKAAIAAGIGRRGVRLIPVDEQFRMDTDVLASAIESDRESGWYPFCVVATVGTTSTTSVDPVKKISRICREQGLWLHVDAAYAGTAAILPENEWVLEGCDRADSIVTNPHKWLFTPIDLSAFYCRRPDVLKKAFSLTPEYLKTKNDGGVTNYMDYGVALGRRFRALKLWMVIRFFGQEGLQQRVRQHLLWAQEFAAWIDASPWFERMAPTPFSTVCFRAVTEQMEDQALDSLNERLLESVNESGEVFLSHTRLNNRFTLRLAIGNLRTRKAHLERAKKQLIEEVKSLIG
jgi:aromatic-L-amino-acid decarboxylase